MTRGRSIRVGGLVLAGLCAFTQPVLAAKLWLLTATPLALTAGVATNVDITATNVGGLLPGEQIGCVTVFVPSATTVLSTSIRSVPAGYTWTAGSSAAAGGTMATFRSVSGKLAGGLSSQSAGLRIRVVSSTAGSQTWQGFAYDASTCDAGVFPQSNLLITITLPSLATPTPAPTSTPGPTGSPTATPATTATPVPTSGPTASPGPASTGTPAPASTSTPRPGSTATPAPGATLSPGPTATPSPSASPGSSSEPGAGPGATPDPEASTGAGGGPDGPGGGQGGITVGGGLDGFALPGAGGAWLAVPASGTGLPGGLDVGAIDLGALGLLLWSVPAAVFGLPGLLLILVALLQATGGAVWLPLVRRWIGGFGFRRRTAEPRS